MMLCSLRSANGEGGAGGTATFVSVATVAALVGSVIPAGFVAADSGADSAETATARFVRTMMLVLTLIGCLSCRFNFAGSAEAGSAAARTLPRDSGPLLHHFAKNQPAPVSDPSTSRPMIIRKIQFGRAA